MAIGQDIFYYTFLLVIHETEIKKNYFYSRRLNYVIIFILVQHVLVKPDVKGIENDVAGPPPSEPE